MKCKTVITLSSPEYPNTLTMALAAQLLVLASCEFTYDSQKCTITLRGNQRQEVRDALKDQGFRFDCDVYDL